MLRPISHPVQAWLRECVHKLSKTLLKVEIESFPAGTFWHSFQLFLVVIDRKIDQNADTGFFEMIYKQIIPRTPAYMGKIKNILKIFLIFLLLRIEFRHKRSENCSKTESKERAQMWTFRSEANSVDLHSSSPCIFIH